MDSYWNQIKITDIRSISNGVSGFRKEDHTRTRFDINMKDGTVNIMNYVEDGDYFNIKRAEKERIEIQSIFNEYNKIPESYTILNDTFIEINGESVLFGYKVEDNLNISQTITLLEAEHLRKEFKLVDTGSRNLVYQCIAEIEFGVVKRGNITKEFIAQMHNLGYVNFSPDLGVYVDGKFKIEEEN